MSWSPRCWRWWDWAWSDESDVAPRTIRLKRRLRKQGINTSWVHFEWSTEEQESPQCQSSCELITWFHAGNSLYLCQIRVEQAARCQGDKVNTMHMITLVCCYSWLFCILHRLILASSRGLKVPQHMAMYSFSSSTRDCSCWAHAPLNTCTRFFRNLIIVANPQVYDCKYQRAKRMPETVNFWLKLRPDALKRPYCRLSWRYKKISGSIGFIVSSWI